MSGERAEIVQPVIAQLSIQIVQSSIAQLGLEDRRINSRLEKHEVGLRRLNAESAQVSQGGGSNRFEPTLAVFVPF